MYDATDHPASCVRTLTALIPTRSGPFGSSLSKREGDKVSIYPIEEGFHNLIDALDALKYPDAANYVRRGLAAYLQTTTSYLEKREPTR